MSYFTYCTNQTKTKIYTVQNNSPLVYAEGNHRVQAEDGRSSKVLGKTRRDVAAVGGLLLFPKSEHIL